MTKQNPCDARRMLHRRRCIFGSITADSTVSFSPCQAATKEKKMPAGCLTAGT